MALFNGSTPWEQRFGWLPHEQRSVEVKKEVEGIMSSLPTFEIKGAVEDSAGKRVVLWDFATKVLGQHLPTFTQEIGDCVSMGMANCANYLQVVQIALGMNKTDGTPMDFHPSFQPYIYGVSRVQIGGGRLGGSDGSIGAWAAEGCKKYGILRADFTGVPPYSGSVARQWGRSGPPANFLNEAKQFLIQTYSPVMSYEQVRDALVNGYPVSVASNRGFRMTLQDRGGKLFGVPSGSWAHQMCFIGVDDTGSNPGCYCMNSWGANAFSPGHKNGEPPGGFWVDPETVTQMCRAEDSFAYSNFDGFPGQKLDFMLVG